MTFATISDGGDLKTRSRNGDERQASAVRVFWSGGETQTAVSGQRIIWYQRSGQVSFPCILHLLRMQSHSSLAIALFKSQHEQLDLNDFITEKYLLFILLILTMDHYFFKYWIRCSRTRDVFSHSPHSLSLPVHTAAEHNDSSIRDCSELC